MGICIFKTKALHFTLCIKLMADEPNNSQSSKNLSMNCFAKGDGLKWSKMNFLLLNWENDIHVRSPSLLRRLDNGSRLFDYIIYVLMLLLLYFVFLRYIITPLHKFAFDKCRQLMRAS